MKSDFLNIGFISTTQKLEAQVETDDAGHILVSLCWVPNPPGREHSRAITIPYAEFCELVGDGHWLVKKVDKLREVMDA